jgi:hypothetical protein
MTWADDDHLYTAYGDGYGFEPGLPEKLGLGFGVVMGDPESGLTCLNIRSDAENTSHGRHGRKASSLLMVDGTLYMWTRNADQDGSQSQLAWSNDYARTWTWADWRFAEFGYPVFINFGPNYSGARDDYVYIVSPDTPSAYGAADRFILMRAPKDRLRERAAYEFLRQVDDANSPVWTTALAERGPVFTNAGQCARSGLSYNPGLQRYLWWQQRYEPDTSQAQAARVDTRFEGGFAIYDAPEPWGPWTTVYLTDRWDIGPGETASFPPKWISPDGRELYLVFSGNDNFAVRKVAFRARQPD